MMIVACCELCVVGRSLLFAGVRCCCRLCVIYCCCLSLLCAVCCCCCLLLFVARCVLFVVCRLFVAVFFVDRCLLAVVRCLLFVCCLSVVIDLLLCDVDCWCSLVVLVVYCLRFVKYC